ncbi:MAG: hypothetical protein GKC03_09485 [Methanomassiliicoccales archaeon]|nr:hypothetical protein [Methanomassiliicoccales archaeon]NYT16070.1 hypothetical protein [Methanomassiliicoccales archaeon]
MARKKRKVEEKEEEYEWVPPEFDEKAFLEKDIKGTRALLVTVVICVIFAVIGYFVSTSVHWALGFVILLVGIVVLRYIYPFTGVDRESLETKTMIGNFVLFFLLFLGLWILFMNPPFSDHTNPSIGEPTIWVDVGGVWTELTDQNEQTLIHAGDPVNITAKVTDNGKLNSIRIEVVLAGESGTFVNMTDVGNNIYGFNATYSQGSYVFTIKATDSAGNISQIEDTFLVNP